MFNKQFSIFNFQFLTVKPGRVCLFFLVSVLCLLASATAASLDVAVIEVNSDVDEIRYARSVAEFERMKPIRFYQAESVRFEVTALHHDTAVDLSADGVFVRWEAYAELGDTNAWIHKIGTVTSGTGGVSQVELVPTESGLDPGDYHSFFRAFQVVDGETNRLGVLAYHRLEVLWSPDAYQYSYDGPFPVLDLSGYATTNALAAHTGDTANPHTVTATQVGLGSADNTADADKPVSTAQQTALDLKLDAGDGTATGLRLDGVVRGNGVAEGQVKMESSYALRVGNVSAEVLGRYALICGIDNSVPGSYSIAVNGPGNHVSGHRSFAAGVGNTVLANRAFIAGSENTIGVAGYNATVFGENNFVNAPSAVSFGRGNTNFSVRGVSFGGRHLLEGASAVAFGKSGWIKTTARNSTHFGSLGIISGNDAVHFGTRGIIEASALRSVHFGEANTLVGVGSFAVGYKNRAEGNRSVAVGAWGKTTRRDELVHSSGRLSAVGDAQTMQLVGSGRTLNNTPERTYFGALNGLVLPTDTTWHYEVRLVARRTDADGESAAYTLSGCIDNNAGVVALVGSPIIDTLAADIAGWAVGIIADDADNMLGITFSGELTKSINWVVFLRLIQITG